MDTKFIDKRLKSIKLQEWLRDLDTEEKQELEEIEKIKSKLSLYSVGCCFLKDLINKETLLQTQLSKNLDLYKERGNWLEYDKTFSQWNKCNLVLWDLKDTLCRMGIDID